MPERANSPAAEKEVSRSLKVLREIFQAGRPLSYIRSAEEQRIGQLLREAAQLFFAPSIPVWSWSMTEGMRRQDGTPAEAEALGARAALDFVVTYDGPAIFHFKDFHEPMRESAEIRRRLRDLYERCFDTGKYVIISSPVRYIPDEITRDLVYLELSVRSS